MSELATLADLRLRTPGATGWSDEEASRAQAYLDDATALVRSEVPGRTLDGSDYDLLSDRQKATLRMVVTACARRAFVNPEGLTQESLGPYGAQASNASSDVYLTANELRQVRRLRGTGGLSSMRLTRGALETHRGADDSYHSTVDPDGVPGEPIAFSEPDTA